MTIGLLGGTFDPPHIGHLQIAQIAIASKKVDRVLFIPCFKHVFGKLPESFEHRLSMCRLLTKNQDDMDVSDIEKSIDHPGRTLSLVKALQKKIPGVDMRLLVGADIYSEREKWYRFELVEQLAPPVYVGRRGVVLEQVETLPAPMEVSSSEIRECIAKGNLPAKLITLEVQEYIVANRLYGVK